MEGCAQRGNAALLEEVVMDVKVLAQPYRGSVSSAEAFLTRALEDPDVNEVLIVTAWVRKSGIERILPGLNALSDRGGISRMFFGVDLRGSTTQGVELASENVSELFVVHDPAGGTFHPKMYLLMGDKIGYGLIGSNNLTAGGLWFNHEAAVLATFDPQKESEISDGIRNYARMLEKDPDICRRVDQQTLNRLKSDDYLADETKRKYRSEDRPRSSRRQAANTDPLFKPSKVVKRDRPPPIQAGPQRRPVSRTQRRRIATSPDSWWKPMEAGDAQHPRVGHPTGNVALTRVPLGQDRVSYFRKVFFAEETWYRTVDGDRVTEIARARFRVAIDDRDMGEHQLEIVWRTYRQTRGRATTVLRWGDQLMKVMRRRDLSGSYLLIEKGSGGLHRLRVLKTEPV